MSQHLFASVCHSKAVTHWTKISVFMLHSTYIKHVKTFQHVQSGVYLSVETNQESDFNCFPQDVYIHNFYTISFSCRLCAQMSNLLCITKFFFLPVVLVVWFCQEIMLQRVMSQIASVKKDMIILEKSEFSTLLAENEVSVFISRLVVLSSHPCCSVLDSYHWRFSIF